MKGSRVIRLPRSIPARFHETARIPDDFVDFIADYKKNGMIEVDNIHIGV